MLKVACLISIPFRHNVFLSKPSATPVAHPVPRECTSRARLPQVCRYYEAASSFDRARALAKSNDNLIDCSNWLYVSLRRASKDQEAAQILTRITPEVKNTEPHLAFYLRLLHFYQGKLTEEAVLPPPPAGPEDLEGELAFNTVSYGVGNWRLYHHNDSAAIDLFSKVVKGEAWNSWGFIGSELELRRKKKPEPR